MDRFPGLRPDQFHVVLQGLKARPFIEAQADKGPERSRVLKVKFQLPITQPVDLLDQGDAENLISTEAATPRVRSSLPDQVLVDEHTHFRMRIQDPGDHLQFSGMLMGPPSGRERELNFSELAHRLPAGFRFVV